MVDAQEPGLVEHLTQRGAAECQPDPASRLAAQQGVAGAPNAALARDELLRANRAFVAEATRKAAALASHWWRGRAKGAGA